MELQSDGKKVAHLGLKFKIKKASAEGVNRISNMYL